MTESKPKWNPKTWQGILLTALFFGSYFVARVGLKEFEVIGVYRILLALLPIPFLAGLLFAIISGIRQWDELEIRIHLEALAVAFPLAMLLLMTLALMELAVELNPEDWSYRHVWFFLPLFYFLGLVIARKRYL